MDALRSFEQSASNSLGDECTPERVLISGNDVDGLMTEQKNHSHNNYIQLTINNSGTTNNAKVENTLRVAKRAEETFLCPGILPTNFQTHNQRQGKEHPSA